MVQLSTPFFTLAVLVTSCLASPLASRDVPTVKADFAKIQTQLQTLDTDIKAFPDTGANLVQAYGIQGDVVTLENIITQATTDVQATGSFSESDGRAILNTFEAAKPVIIDALNSLVKKKPAFDGLSYPPVPAIILQDLKTLSSDTSAFEAALISKTPADLVGEANSVKTAIDKAFATAIAAWS